MMIYVFDKVENIVRKEENAGYQNFLLFLQCFLWLSISRLLMGFCGKELKPYNLTGLLLNPTPLTSQRGLVTKKSVYSMICAQMCYEIVDMDID